MTEGWVTRDKYHPEQSEGSQIGQLSLPALLCAGIETCPTNPLNEDWIEY
jgi:hypothetical protein